MGVPNRRRLCVTRRPGRSALRTADSGVHLGEHMASFKLKLVIWGWGLDPTGWGKAFGYGPRE